MLRLVICCSTILYLTGCASMYPGTLDENPVINNDTAILLVGITGAHSVNYLQFCPESPPCKNYRFPAIHNDVIALKIPVPQSGLHMASFTLAGSAVGYTPQGVGFGFIGVKGGPKFDVANIGIYYHGVLNTDTGEFNSMLNTEIIQKAKSKYKPMLSKLKPVNFTW
jgi:hypothetical protein